MSTYPILTVFNNESNILIQSYYCGLSKKGRYRDSIINMYIGTYSNLPNNSVGPFNCVGDRFLRNQ